MLYKTFPLGECKAGGDEAKGLFSGRASVYGNEDSYGDVVMPGAFKSSLKNSGGRVVVLNQHDSHDSIGLATLDDRDDGLHVTEGKLELELQSARDAYVRLKSGLITGISIGYETVKEKTVKNVRELHEIKLWEVSLVTFPANDKARVTGVKSAPGSMSADEFADRMQELFAEVKAGRMISAANMKVLQAAYDSGSAMCAALKELMDAATTEDGKSNETPDLSDLEGLMAKMRFEATA